MAQMRFIQFVMINALYTIHNGPKTRNIQFVMARERAIYSL